MLNKKDFLAESHYLEALSLEKFVAPDYWKIGRDTWTLYSYGKGFKVVYLKYGGEASRSLALQNNPPVQNKSEERFLQSISRTKSTIFELAFCNEFSHFCTFTQNEDLVGSRFDLAKFRKDLAQFVRNQNRFRDEKIKYLFVPEQHKNGAWHMHGLVAGLKETDLREFTLKERLPRAIIKQLKNGEKIYNWEKYSQKFGFFTATNIKSHEACAKYIVKYITKEVARTAIEKGHHMFFASQGLKRREMIHRVELTPCPVSKWDFENDFIKSAWFDNAEELAKVWSKSQNWDFD